MSEPPAKKQKKFHKFRSVKPHVNPLSDLGSVEYPLTPQQFDVKKYFPKLNPPKPVDFADVGCGFGGLLYSLATAYPNNVAMGLEIRHKVVEYVAGQIASLEEKNPGKYTNVGVVNTNAMKYIANFFQKGQLKKIFFLFPDPHFKKANHRRRIVSPQLVSIYAHILAVGGIAYTITDVEDLHQWMAKHFTDHPLFERISEEELKNDPTIPLVYGSTDESKKVDRTTGKKHLAVFRRIELPSTPNTNTTTTTSSKSE